MQRYKKYVKNKKKYGDYSFECPHTKIINMNYVN